MVKETSEEKTVKENSLLHTKNHRKKKGIPAHGFFLIKLAANFTGKGVGTEERQYYKEEGRP
ncbi:hypothetical protein [Bacillus infantis]|uniref:hypothetical protein n=1 Tax=Bacillus infantis TaxID=324767 RepID=UPI0030180E98